MGTTAKLMLVGVLAMVIVIAVIWDRHSGDLERISAVGSGVQGDIDRLSPTLAQSSPQVEGTIKGRPKTPQETEAEEMLQRMKEHLRASSIPATDDQPAEPAATAQENQREPAPEEPKAKTYIVKEGESFWTIARDVYGDGTLCDELWKANIEKCPRGAEYLRAGMTIVLPDLKKDRMRVRPETLTASSPGPNGERYYTVKEGDCLSIISQKFYGTSRKWQKILKANSLEDDTSLRAGMKIVIPPDNN